MGKAVTAFVLFVCLAGFVSAPKPRAIAWVEAPRFEAGAWLRGGDRFPEGAVVRISDANGQRALVPDFAASADPAVSFDGTRLLFAGKKNRGDSWQVFETAVNGGATRQVTSGDGGCIRPLYLPEDQVAYTRVTPAGSWIELVSLSGGAAQRLTFSNSPALTADVLRDGRILFETEFRTGDTAVREIMTVYPDGTGVEAVRCDHGGDRHSPYQASSGDIVFVQNGRLKRFTSALAHATDLAGSADASPLRSVVLERREPPKRFPSALVASRTAVNLLCLDVHISREPMNGAGISAVRVFTRNSTGVEQQVGDTAVEKDGSFFVQVPADRPIRMELVDSTGRVLRGEKNWWWGRPAEQRVCVGCHAGPERAPDNAVPDVLLRKDVPVKMLAVAEAGR